MRAMSTDAQFLFCVEPPDHENAMTEQSARLRNASILALVVWRWGLD